VSWAHVGFGFLEDITMQDINGARVHLGDLLKRCTKCERVLPLVDGFGQLRKMTPEGLEYRSQAQCKLCRGEK
jgi:hypothetical protein